MLLALERSGAAASAAIFPPGGGAPLASVSAPAGGRGDAWPLVRDALAAAGIAARDLSALAVGTGPGSFSGIRSALALAQGLAAPDALPVRGVLSAAAAVFGWRRAHPGAPRARLLGDARRGHVWRFDEPDDWAALSHSAADLRLHAAPSAADGPGAPARPPLAEALKGAGVSVSILAADPARLAPLLGGVPSEPAAATAEDVAALFLAGSSGPALPVYLHAAVGDGPPS